MQPIVAPDSPLIRLPETVSPIQASFIDAMRLCAQAVDFAYRRIQDALSRATPSHDRALAVGPSAVMDSWEIVDTVHRLRALVSHFPGYKNRAPSKQLFLKRTAGVEELRNIFQHLVGDLPALTKADVPVLGSLSWLVPIDIEKRTFAASIFSPGRVRNLDPASVVELPAELPNELTQIELHLAEKTVNITSLRAAVADLVSALEKPLREASGNTTLCDALSHVVLEYLPKDEAP